MKGKLSLCTNSSSSGREQCCIIFLQLKSFRLLTCIHLYGHLAIAQKKGQIRLIAMTWKYYAEILFWSDTSDLFSFMLQPYFFFFSYRKPNMVHCLPFNFIFDCMLGASVIISLPCNSPQYEAEKSPGLPWHCQRCLLKWRESEHEFVSNI